MAIRNIVTQESSVLHKISRKVINFDDRLSILIDDMIDTLKESDGVGLAAPQVGILKRVVLVNVGDSDGLIELINPSIVEQSGEQCEGEGCLSCPGKYGITRRPMWVKVQAQDRHGKTVMFEGEGLKARAFCHELDHLDGILFIKRAIKMIDPQELD